MKKMLVLVVLLSTVGVSTFDAMAFSRTRTSSTTTPGPSSSTDTTNTTESTTVTTTQRCSRWGGRCRTTGTSTAVTKSTTGTIPGDTSGMNFTCSETITNGLTSVKSSVMDVPSSLVSGLFGDVLSATGLSMGMSPIVSKVLDLLRNRAADLCNRAVPLVVDPSGAESSTMSELTDIVGENSSYVTQLTTIAGQMSSLATSASSGGLDATEAQDLYNDFNALQADQISILESMDQEMDNLSTDHAEVVSSAPPRGSEGMPNIASTLPGCTNVPVVNINSPTAAELAAMSAYLVCTTNASGACCANSCDAVEHVADPGNIQQSEKDAVSAYGSGCVPMDSAGSDYCCFN